MKRFFAFVWNVIFAAGVLLPLHSLVMELLTHACAAEFFDPIPTWRHVVLVALMPLGLALLWVAKRRDQEERWKRLGTVAHGVMLGSVLLYVAAMGPMNLFGVMLLPFAVVAIFEPMFPLLILALIGPLAALVVWLGSLRRVWRWHERRLWIGGLLAGGVLVIVAELPMVLMHERLLAAETHLRDVEREPEAFEVLRTPGNEAFLHRLCYSGGGPKDFGPLGHIFDSQQGLGGMLFKNWGLRTSSFNIETLRSIHFRVTGTPFSDLPPPRGTVGMRRGLDFIEDSSMDAFAWDGERGGDEVGARIRGLSLATSRLDWHVDAPSALAHGEWTLEFHNEHANAQEARCQMLLPPGGCVSRLTLWIEGEPREAAFGAKSAVKAAYKQVVQVESRDPVMVNMVGPDRVMTQCFPVPPKGVMKIRLGITAPSEHGLPMPLIIDRNFSIAGGLKHAVWVQSKSPLEDNSEAADAVKAKDGSWSWQEEVRHAQIDELAFHAKEAPAPKVWTEDPLAGTEPKFVVRELSEAPAVKKRLMVVIDASAKLAPHAALLRSALEKLPADTLEAIFVSTDAEAEEVKAADLNAQTFRGGRDAVPALKAALKRCRQAGEDCAIVWLHGPQPVDMTGKEAIQQLLERDAAPPVIHAIGLVPGRNKLLEDLYDSSAIQGGSRWDGTEKSLLESMTASSSASRKYSRADQAPADAPQVWEQLARHAVFTEVMAAFRGRDRVPEVQAQKAAQHQLVTPYSGAVVLETQAQYDRAGLKPVDGNTTPQIPTSGAPEPSRTLLLIMGLIGLVGRRRR
jgi:hypothetical protein